jgi:hypothetical protein
MVPNPLRARTQLSRPVRNVISVTSVLYCISLVESPLAGEHGANPRRPGPKGRNALMMVYGLAGARRLARVAKARYPLRIKPSCCALEGV